MPPFPATLLSSTTGPYSNLSDAGIGLSVAVEANNCEYSGCKLATVLRKRRRWPQARLPQDLRLARAPAYSPSLVDEDCGRFYSLHVPITSPQPLGVAGQRRGSAPKDIGEEITGNRSRLRRTSETAIVPTPLRARLIYHSSKARNLVKSI